MGAKRDKDTSGEIALTLNADSSCTLSNWANYEIYGGTYSISGSKISLDFKTSGAYEGTIAGNKITVSGDEFYKNY